MRLAIKIAAISTFMWISDAALSAECGMSFDPPVGPHQTPIWASASGVAAFYFQSNSDVDADGSGRAYHPDDIAANKGLAQDSICDGVSRRVSGAVLSCTDGAGDCQKCYDHFRSVPKAEMLAHFGEYFSAFGIATDGEKRACLVESGENRDFFVSPSAYEDQTKGRCDPARYLDANLFPGVAIPATLSQRGVAMGDLVVARNRQNGRMGFGLVYDKSGGRIGESSVMMNRLLTCVRGTSGANCVMPPVPTRLSETNALVVADVEYLVFKGSAGAWPTSPAEIAAKAKARFQEWGGEERLAACDAFYSR